VIFLRFCSILIATVCSATSLAWAAQKPSVQVVLEFAENGYRKQLASKTVVVERAALEKLLHDLNAKLPFLRFTSDPQDAVLHVRLGNASGSSEMHAVNFELFVGA
jgi:hypothetical protein